MSNLNFSRPYQYMANIAEHLKEEGKLFHDGNPNNGLINRCEEEWGRLTQSDGINYDANDNHLNM